MNTKHVNAVDSSGCVYCHRLNDIVPLTHKHFTEQCAICPYFSGTAGMQGVECTFNDHSNEDILFFDNASESEKHTQYVGVRLGYESEQHVNDRLKGFGADTGEIYGDYDEEPPEGSNYIEDEKPEDDAENLEVKAGI